MLLSYLNCKELLNKLTRLSKCSVLTVVNLFCVGNLEVRISVKKFKSQKSSIKLIRGHGKSILIYKSILYENMFKLNFFFTPLEPKSKV